MKLYLAGPMRDLPEFNFPQFHSAAKYLCEQGYEVFNPTEHDSPTVEDDYRENPLKTARVCFARDTLWICTQAEGVVLLPGWHNSKGARAERALALAIGLEEFHLHWMPNQTWFLTQVVERG